KTGNVFTGGQRSLDGIRRERRRRLLRRTNGMSCGHPQRATSAIAPPNENEAIPKFRIGVALSYHQLASRVSLGSYLIEIGGRTVGCRYEEESELVSLLPA